MLSRPDTNDRGEFCPELPFGSAELLLVHHTFRMDLTSSCLLMLISPITLRYLIISICIQAISFGSMSQYVVRALVTRGIYLIVRIVIINSLLSCSLLVFSPCCYLLNISEIPVLRLYFMPFCASQQTIDLFYSF